MFARNVSSRTDLNMIDAEKRAFWLVGRTRNLPAVGEDDLLDDGKAKASPLFICREIGFENFCAMLGRHTRTIVANFDIGIGRSRLAESQFDIAAVIDRLNGVEHEIKQR